MVNGGSDGAAVALDVADVDKNDTKKRRFLRGLRRMFRRRGHREASDVPRDGSGGPENREPPTDTPNTQRLLAMEDGHRRKSSSVHQSGLSVSHDSVFTGEASGASGGESDEERVRSSSSTSERKRRHHHHHHHHHNYHGGAPPLNAELAAAVRRRARGDTSEEDEDLGLPRSPPASPPKRGSGINGVSGVREQSSCSEGSLLSAGSSQSEDDCRSSRGDLTHSTFDSSDLDGQEPLGGLAPLSHSAAKHKMAVKPRRTHGAPRRNRPKQISPASVLPTTPEVNEDIARSVTPEVSVTHKSTDTALSTPSMPSDRHNIMITSSYEMTQSVTNSEKSTDSFVGQVSQETKLKSSSLPPGLALSQMMGQAGTSPMKLSVSSSEELGNSIKITRSKSNAQAKDDNKQTNELQSSSERNLTSFTILSYQSHKNVDSKYKYGSLSEDEELSDSLEKNKKHDKTEKYRDIASNEQITKNKHNDESEDKHSNKKEESFFNRLLLRRSGKKVKKDSLDKDDHSEEMKKQSNKSISSDQIPITKSMSDHGIVRQQKMMCSDQHAHKSVGQKVFLNQSHKRIDSRGGYTQDPMSKSSIEFSSSDGDHLVNKEFSKSKEDISAGRLSSENIMKGQVPSLKIRQRVEPTDIPISPDQQKKPPLLPRSSSHEQKSLFPIINQGKVYPSKDSLNGGRYMKNSSRHHSYSDDYSQDNSSKTKSKIDNNFGIGQIIKQTESIIKPLSYSVSPPKSVWPQTYSTSEYKSVSQGSLDSQGMRHSKSDYNTKYFDYPNQMHHDYELESSKSKPKIAGLSSYQQKISLIGNSDNDSDIVFADSGSPRNPVIKSHSFRHNSDTLLSTQDNMPSLPPMYGISESSMDSWESTYKKNIRDISDGPSSLELGSDSLMNYSYKNEINRGFTETGVFVVPNVLDLKDDLINNIICDKTKAIKVQDDISKIEANIDSIIGNPKPLTCIALKSSSLDSVKSLNDKSEQGRKAHSNESISSKIYLNQSSIPDVVGSVSFSPKLSPDSNKSVSELKSKSSIDLPSTGIQPSDNHVSVTVFNSSESGIIIPPLRTPELVRVTTQHFDFTNVDKSPKQQLVQKETKTVEKSVTDSSIPEFMKIQLNKVDQKPASNVVLTTGASNDSKNKSPTKVESNYSFNSQVIKKPDVVERGISYEPKKSDSTEKIVEETFKPHRKFCSEDVEILEKSDINNQNNSINVQLRKSSLQNRSSEILNGDSKYEEKTISTSLRKSPSSVSNLPPPSPTANKSIIKKKSGTFDFIESNNDVNKRQSTPILGIELRTAELNLIEKNTVAQGIKRMSSHELLGVDHNPRIDRSSSSSDDCNLESTVIFRKKSISSIGQRSSTPKDDEPELMKVFARRSLKLKDSETEAITQDIMKLAHIDNENVDNGEANKKSMKNDFNIMTRSRDSDKENETDSPKDERKKLSNNDFNKQSIEFRKNNNDTSDLNNSQRMPKKLHDLNPVSVNNNSNVQASKPTSVISYSGYQRSVSTNIPVIPTNVNNNKTENNSNKTENKPANNKSEINNYKKDVSDSTPEKRLRNRTFPDSSNENKIEDNKSSGTKTDQFSQGTSSLPKKPWSQIKSEENLSAKDILKPLRKSSFAVPTVESKPIAANNKTVLEKFPINKSISERNVPLIGNKNILNNDKNSTCKESKDNTEKSGPDSQDVDDKKSSTSVESIPAENKSTNEADDSPQFKGILQMRAEWERRAQQAMTK